MRVCAVLVSLCVGACGFGDNSLSHIAAGDDDGSSGHGSDAGTDSGGNGKDGGRHLLITEIKATGAGEFVEIFNPTTATIDLSDYYLSDSNEYWKLPGHIAGSDTITLLTSDFLVRFPVDTIAPGEVGTIALDELDFGLEWGISPNLTIKAGGLGAALMTEVISTTSPTITDTGEMIVLFHWDGDSDLVDDVDLAISGGSPVAANLPIAKDAVDGPDPDSDVSRYAVDARSFTVPASATSAAQTYKRIALEDGHETTGTTGNGITGHDETSEDLRASWDVAPFTVGTPGTVPAALLE